MFTASTIRRLGKKKKNNGKATWWWKIEIFEKDLFVICCFDDEEKIRDSTIGLSI